ncbi:MAG TPA: hypothetical protein VFU02_11090 [Polyangiaceae bacterium]|nr:hypothetical protein [Polyangiaceae bacterium]
MRLSSHVYWFGCVLGCVALPAIATASPRAESRLSSTKTPEGRPEVHLDRLDFPQDVAGSRELRVHLERVLKKEVRRVEWGAGRDNRIEYRFSVTKLDLAVNGDVVEVSCTALGALPGGRTAKSQLTFGGAASEQQRVIKQVLEIVARGVITRLAQLERRRRGLD